MKRRDFFMNGTLLSAVAMPAVAARLSTSGGVDGFDTTIPRPTPTVESIKTNASTIQHTLALLAKEAVRLIRIKSTSSIAFLGWYDGLVLGGDTVHEHNTRTTFDVHLVADTQALGLDLVSLNDAQILTTFAPAMNQLATLFVKTSEGKTVKMARLPDPLPNCGAIAESFTDGSARVRAIASYDPNRLCMMFSFDMLYGHVEKI